MWWRDAGRSRVTVRPVPDPIRENDIELDVRGKVTAADVKQVVRRTPVGLQTAVVRSASRTTIPNVSPGPRSACERAAG